MWWSKLVLAGGLLFGAAACANGGDAAETASPAIATTLAVTTVAPVAKPPPATTARDTPPTSAGTTSAPATTRLPPPITAAAVPSTAPDDRTPSARHTVPVSLPMPDPSTALAAVAPSLPPAVVAAPPPSAPASPASPVNVLIAGDSTGVELSVEMEAYEVAHPEQIHASHAAFFGCGLSVADDGRLHEWNGGQELIDLAGCTGEWSSIPLRILAEDVDVVVVSIGAWDGGVIRFPDGTRVSVLDPVGRQLIVDAYQAFATAVREAGAVPLWVRPADVDIDWDAKPDPLDDPARWVALREIVDGLGVAQIDLPAFLTAHGVDGPAGRPDGVHLAPEVLTTFVADSVVPDLLALAAGR